MAPLASSLAGLMYSAVLRTYICRRTTARTKAILQRTGRAAPGLRLLLAASPPGHGVLVAQAPCAHEGHTTWMQGRLVLIGACWRIGSWTATYLLHSPSIRPWTDDFCLVRCCVCRRDETAEC